MANFHEVVFPTDISIGALGGPEFRTTILGLGSGHEKRNIEWSLPRGSWDVGTGLRRRLDDVTHGHGFTRFIAFFHARMGRAYGFRFRDWSDFQIIDTSWTVGDGSPSDDSLVIASGSSFQLHAQYESGGYSFYRRILKPTFPPLSSLQPALEINSVPLLYVPGTYTGGVYTPAVLNTGEWAFNPTTGVVVTGTTLVTTDLVNVAYMEFELPVRFDVDKLNLNMAAYEAGEIPHIPVIELKSVD